MWTSGPWQGGTFASLYDYSSFSSSYNFTYVSKDSEVYLMYNVYNESLMLRIVIVYSGQMFHYAWSEARQAWIVLMLRPDSCSTYAKCGPNTICNINYSPACTCLNRFVPVVKRHWYSSDFSNGCMRMRLLQCSKDKTGFMKVTTTRLPANPEYEYLEVKHMQVCVLKQLLLQCLCLRQWRKMFIIYRRLAGFGWHAKQFSGGGSYVKTEYKVKRGLRDDDLYSMLPHSNHHFYLTGKKKVPLVAVVLPITAAALISCSCFCYLWPNLKNRESREAHQNLLLLDLNTNGPAHNKRTSVGSSHEEAKTNQYELPIFSFSSIVVSTNNFSITNKVGEGGFGPVYKVELLNGQFVALKRLSRISGQGLEEFRNETELIAKLQHRNLVGISGCCVENDEKILVYEYMPNKSLDFFLFEPTRKLVLDWKKRVHIIEGIAQGLLYLHHYSRLRVVQRDLKASDILLDAMMKPKIFDFGMARIFGVNDWQANTERIVGTYGYMSPEYAMDGIFLVKSDVFAFGVLMLEIISGKKNTGFYGSEHLSLLGYAWKIWKHDSVLDLIDSTLEIPASSPSIPLRYIQIGLLCVEENPADRPLMSDVPSILLSILGELWPK